MTLQNSQKNPTMLESAFVRQRDITAIDATNISHARQADQKYVGKVVMQNDVQLA